MLPGTDNGTTLENPTFLHAITAWCQERETYPSRLEVRMANTLRARMKIHVEVQPQKTSIPTTGDTQVLPSRHVLIDEKLTESTADRLTTALRAIQKHQGLVFRQGLCYMTLIYLVSCDLERTQAGKPSLLFTNEDAQREEYEQEAVSPLWSLDNVLQFWERLDGHLDQGFLPPPDSHGGRWSYNTIPPLWFPDEVAAAAHPASELLYREDDITSSETVRVPPSWKHWIENLVALNQVSAQCGVHINISVGAVATEPLGLSMAEANLFRQKGEVWDIVYQGHSFSLKHIKGLSYIAFLLRHPTQKFTPYELRQGIGESVPVKSNKVYSSMSAEGLEKLGLHSSAWDAETSGELIVKGEVLQQYQQTLADLKEQKEEAELYHDYERAARLQVEIEKITAYLTNTTHRGTIKTIQTESDKIRTGVTKRIHDAIKKIHHQDETLARYLHRYIRTEVLQS